MTLAKRGVAAVAAFVSPRQSLFWLAYATFIDWEIINSVKNNLIKE